MGTFIPYYVELAPVRFEPRRGLFPGLEPGRKNDASRSPDLAYADWPSGTRCREAYSLRKFAADIHGITLGLDEYPPVARVVLEPERQDFRSKRANLLGGKIHHATDQRIQ